MRFGRSISVVFKHRDAGPFPFSTSQQHLKVIPRLLNLTPNLHTLEISFSYVSEDLFGLLNSHPTLTSLILKDDDLPSCTIINDSTLLHQNLQPRPAGRIRIFIPIYLEEGYRRSGTNSPKSLDAMRNLVHLVPSFDFKIEEISFESRTEEYYFSIAEEKDEDNAETILAIYNSSNLSSLAVEWLVLLLGPHSNFQHVELHPSYRIGNRLVEDTIIPRVDEESGIWQGRLSSEMSRSWEGVEVGSLVASYSRFRSGPGFWLVELEIAMMEEGQALEPRHIEAVAKEFGDIVSLKLRACSFSDWMSS